VSRAALQRFVVHTSDGPLGAVYRGLYRAPERLARRWLPDDVIDVTAIRSVDAPGFLVGVSDIDLLAVIRSSSGEGHVDTAAAIARGNHSLRRLFPFFQHCFSVTEQELRLPAADHWLGVYSPSFRARLPLLPARPTFARLLALQHACRWLFRGGPMPAMFHDRRGGTLVNHQRRSFRILRELAFGLGRAGDTLHDEATFGLWQRRVATSTGLPWTDGAGLAESCGWYTSPEGVLAVWRFALEAARSLDRSVGVPEMSEPGDWPAPAPEWMGSVASVFERLGVRVVAGGSGERETDEEAYLLVEEDRDVTPALFSTIAKTWRACRGEAPAIAGVAPMILTPSLLRWLCAVTPWRSDRLRAAEDASARSIVGTSFPWQQHARLATLFWVCRDFREDIQGTSDEIASIARFSLPRLLIAAVEGHAPTTPERVHARFLECFGGSAWGYGALRDGAYRLEESRAGLAARVRFFAAGLPLAAAAFERLLAAVESLPSAPPLPALKGPTPLLDRLSTVGDAPRSTKLTS
jgi:hypothetical protein